jgi:hypothetical protein
MATWHDINIEFPEDGQAVWVRRFGSYKAYEAEFDGEGYLFTWPNGDTLPWEWATKWTDRPT